MIKFQDLENKEFHFWLPVSDKNKFIIGKKLNNSESDI